MFNADCLLKQHDWYYATLELLLAHCASVPLEKRHEKLEGFGWPTIHGQLMHIAEAEAWWVASVEGRKINWPRDSDWWDFAECERSEDLAIRYQEVREATRKFYLSLSQEEIQKPRWLSVNDETGFNVSPALMLSHLITHGFHHKGQIVAMTRILGYPPPETDLDSQISTADFPA